MTRRAWTILAVTLATAAPRVAFALATNCIVGATGVQIPANVPSAGKFLFISRDANFAIPMDIDETTGAVTMHRGGLPTVDVGTAGGPVTVYLAGADVTGTLDGAGGLVIPGFAMKWVFATIELPITPDLSTGTQVLPDPALPTEGVPLDFTTGVVTITGVDIIPDAPIVSGPAASGVRITCTMNPIPDPKKLPKGASLKGVRGKIAGDTLTLRGVLSAGGTPIDPKSQDLVVRLGGSVDAFLALAGTQAAAGAIAPAARAPRDVSVLAGLATGATEPTSAKVTLKGSKKRATFSLRVSGLDLSAVTGNVNAHVAVGLAEGTVPLVVLSGKLKTAH